MKIKSLIREPHPIILSDAYPLIFTVGEPPVEESPVVKSIVLFDQGAYGENTRGLSIFKGYKGACYLVSFVDSTTKRIVPAKTVVDIAVDSEPSTKTKAQVDTDATAEASAIPEN